jgi:hypothetical protein
MWGTGASSTPTQGPSSSGGTLKRRNPLFKCPAPAPMEITHNNGASPVKRQLFVDEQGNLFFGSYPF